MLVNDDWVKFSRCYVVLIAPVTRDTAAVKTDASVWASRIVSILDNLSHVEHLAGQLKHHLRTDELTRQTHDNFYAQCLGAVVNLPCLYLTMCLHLMLSFAS